MQKIKRLFSPHIFGGAGTISEDERVMREVLGVLSEYRARKSRKEAIRIETAIPLSREIKHQIIRSLNARPETPVVEYINASLGNSFQVIHEQQIHIYKVDHRLEHLKSRLIHM